jgi:predicted HicB family RNase H-like nuclease
MEQNEIMTSGNAGVKQITIRWVPQFWEAVSIAATKRRTSVQALVTEAVAEKLGIPLPGESGETAA